MTDQDKISANLSTALENGANETAIKVTHQTLEAGMRSLDIIQKILMPTLTDVGTKFQNFEIFLPKLMLVGEIAEKISAIVEQATLDAGEPSLNLGTV
ncbi:MAG: hypothetical protein DRI65_17550, partial [Chloroflexota bacterium]